MSQTVLFLCPHNAAKSIIAAAYFQQLADQYDLELQADTAGTEPDDEVWPQVIELLHADGLSGSDHRPRHVAPQDIANASRIISMNCDIDESLATEPVEHWDDLPKASDDLLASRDAIRDRVEDLVARYKAAATTGHR